MRRIYFKLFAVLIWFSPIISHAQLSNLKTQQQGKKTFSEIAATVEQNLATAPDSYEKEKFKKHFARWAYYQSLHLGPNGELVNISKKTFEAVRDKVQTLDRSANGDWSFVGPNSAVLDNPGADILGNGRADRIAFHPTNTSIFYVGTPAGGLWKTTNGGTNWTSVSGFIPSLGISGIVVDHSDPNTIYVLTGDGDAYRDGHYLEDALYLRRSVGVLVSYDAGLTWEQTGQLSTEEEWVGFRLAQHPTDSDILIAATSDGIYRTIDAGDTWVQERAGKHYDVEFKPADPTRVYASGVGEFVYSSNTGDTWNTNASFDFPLCDGGRVELAVTPYNSNKVFLLAGPVQAGNMFCGFYVSTNSGLDFYRWSNSPNILGKEDGSGNDQSNYDMGLAVSPLDDQLIIAGGLTTFRSTNGGSVFNNATIYRENGVDEYIHPDIHGIEFNSNGDLYAVGDGGAHKSLDDGVSYTDIYTGLNTAQFYGMTDYDANQYALLAGCQDNGVKYKTTNTSQFKQIYCCDAADAIINYSDVTNGYIVINTHVYRFTNFTTTAPTRMITTGWFPKIEMHSSNPDIVYVGYSRIREYTSGAYTAILGDADIKGWWALKTCPSNTSVIYAAGGDSFYDTIGGMFVSTNSGTDWSTISDNTGFPATYNRISDIGVRSNSSQSVYACFSGYTDNQKVYYSYNYGDSWSNISYDLPNIPVWSIEVDASNNVYVGTDYGVFYKASAATNWEPFYNNLPNVPVSDLAINETAGVLHASTYGRGIWKSTLRDPCPTNKTISTDLQGQNFYSASNSITMTGEVVGGEGTSVWLRSGNYVDLEAGFKADGEPGNKFLAYVGDCDDGMPPEFSFGNPSDTTNNIIDFTFSLNRNLGTIEIKDVSDNVKNVIVRLFTDSPSKVKVFLSDQNGRYIMDVADFKGQKGKTEYTLQTSDLEPGMYYLYLGIDQDINHLQEVYIK